MPNSDPDIYENKGHTVAKQNLGNRKFSAPEQSKPDVVPSPSMDIYAFVQIIQWLSLEKHIQEIEDKAKYKN